MPADRRLLLLGNSESGRSLTLALTTSSKTRLQLKTMCLVEERPSISRQRSESAIQVSFKLGRGPGPLVADSVNIHTQCNLDVRRCQRYPSGGITPSSRSASISSTSYPSSSSTASVSSPNVGVTPRIGCVSLRRGATPACITSPNC